MAVYEYACIQCNLDYEKERPINDAEQKYYCEKCGYSLQRVYSPFGIAFKGRGFYTNGG
jgi:putative FmdB family regulatory protein